MTKERSLLQILGSVAIGVGISFVITYMLGIQFSDELKIIISVLPSVVAIIWATNVKRILSARLWSSIGHGITFGLINFVFEKAFFDGLEALSI